MRAANQFGISSVINNFLSDAYKYTYIRIRIYIILVTTTPTKLLWQGQAATSAITQPNYPLRLSMY